MSSYTSNTHQGNPVTEERLKKIEKFVNDFFKSSSRENKLEKQKANQTFADELIEDSKKDKEE